MPTVYGSPNSRRDNIVVICHALTGTSAVADWWPGIVGPGALFDPTRWCVVGVDINGTTLRDVVSAQREAIDELGFERIRFVVGGSLGGMQALQWALDVPERVGHAIVIGAHDHHSTMGIALNGLQREAIALDPVAGLSLARKIAMLTYKSEELFTQRHSRLPDRNDPSRFDVEGYLAHQGAKFVARMDSETYVARTRLMDGFDVRHRAREPHAPLTFIGINSDWLFRAQDVRAAAKRFDANYFEMVSNHGHDAFLAEPEHLARIVRRGVIDYSMTVA